MNSNIIFLSILLINVSLANFYPYYNVKDKLNYKISELSTKPFEYDELSDHTLVTDSNVFPYVVAISKKNKYLSTGALIDENWVLTAADSLFLFREGVRTLRVRLGSINNRKGGIVVAVKYIEIHPYFRDTKPEFDIALIRLAYPVRLTPSLNPIRMQQRLREVTATHFIVTSWPASTDGKKGDSAQHKLKSMEIIKRQRMLTVSHLHPTETESCVSELEDLDVNNTETIMCLEHTPGSKPCSRDIGAPVVLNRILWGITSSWKSEDCDVEPDLSFVTLVAAREISSWIIGTVRGTKWNGTQGVSEEVDEDNYILD